MHTILTTLVLCLLVSAANAEDDPQGYQDQDWYQHQNNGALHGFYAQLYNSKKGVSCCHDKDCRPTTAKHTNNGWEVKINGAWWIVDEKSIILKSAPDGGAHVCAGDPSQQDPLGRVYCVILPPEG